MRLARSSGILLHPTSLPGGVLDEHAYRFVDWLSAAGQRWWQVLPLGPTDETGSPYMSPSAFAGSPNLLADPDRRVTHAERRAFRERHAYWIDDWLAFDGADHRAHAHLFQRGEVAGVPPDAVAKGGQLWGNPLYDWPAARREGYHWWIERLRRTFELVDLTRIDHFRGFVSYWAVPARYKTAVRGRWRRGPGADVFHAAERSLGPLPVIAEDLGVITEPVVRLRQELGFPGMVVLQFATNRSSRNPHLLRNHLEQSVVYTGTHDNDTALGWWRHLTDRRRAATGLAGI